MARNVAIGIQDFEKLRKSNCFYVDKTNFIKECWGSADDVTLIAVRRAEMAKNPHLFGLDQNN